MTKKDAWFASLYSRNIIEKEKKIHLFNVFSSNGKNYLLFDMDLKVYEVLFSSNLFLLYYLNKTSFP